MIPIYNFILIGEIMREVRESGFRERLPLTIDPEENRTKEQFGDAVNINTIMRKALTQGIVPEQRGEPGHYGDFSNVVSYGDAMQALNDANNSFSELDADLRRRFDNDPQQLLLFMEDPDNADEARELGILPPLPVEKPAPEVPEKSEGETPPAEPEETP